MKLSKKHLRNKRINNKAPPNGKNRVGRPNSPEGDKKKPNGIPERMWAELKSLLPIEEKEFVSELIRKILSIYLSAKLQAEADRQDIPPSTLLERSVDWYLNTRDEERKKKFQAEHQITSQ